MNNSILISSFKYLQKYKLTVCLSIWIKNSIIEIYLNKERYYELPNTLLLSIDEENNLFNSLNLTSNIKRHDLFRNFFKRISNLTYIFINYKGQNCIWIRGKKYGYILNREIDEIHAFKCDNFFKLTANKYGLLYDSCRYGFVDVVKILLNNNMFILSKTKSNCLIFAVKSRNKATIKLLLENDVWNSNVLSFVDNKDFELIFMLIHKFRDHSLIKEQLIRFVVQTNIEAIKFFLYNNYNLLRKVWNNLNIDVVRDYYLNLVIN